MFLRKRDTFILHVSVDVFVLENKNVINMTFNIIFQALSFM